MPGEHFVIKQRGSERRVALGFLVSAVLAACGGGSTGHPSAEPGPVTSPRGVVEQFLEAVADSNVQKMGMLWGTSAGPAAKTNQPPDWERRIVVMQAYLQNEGTKVTGDAPDNTSPERHLVQVELRRQLCTKSVPFTVIKLPDGSWVVNQVDLGAAGNPARPCLPSNEQDTTAAR
jgi:hypothetical protein